MTLPVLFEFEAQPVRVINEEGGEPWFYAVDVCQSLDLSDTNKALLGLDDDERREHEQYSGSGRKPILINESGLYSLILRSRKPSAKRFKRWVTHEVLPSIRKTGSYQTGNRSTAAARIANHRLRLSLAKELYRTRDGELRQMIHQQLADVSNALGLPVPELNSIGRAAPKGPDVVKDFWNALAFLDAKGVDYNHACVGNLLAVNLPQLADLLIEHGYPLRFDRVLYLGLEQNESPRCLHKNHGVHSRLTSKSIKCWVFERPAE